MDVPAKGQIAEEIERRLQTALSPARLIVSNDRADLSADYDTNDGFEVITHDFTLFPVTENVPEDPIVAQLLMQGTETELADRGS